MRKGRPPWAENMDRIRSSRVAYVVLAWGVVLAVLLQVSLIGLWLFAGQPTMLLHKELGHGITLMIVALLVLAFMAPFPRGIRWTTASLAAISIVQTEVFALLPGSPLRAFHPVLALVIFFLAAVLARQAVPFVRGRPEAAAVPRPVAEPRAQ
jgi:Family of unknown function (DUF6220)